MEKAKQGKKNLLNRGKQKLLKERGKTRIEK